MTTQMLPMHYWLTVGEVDRIRGKLCRGIDLKHGGTGFVVCPPSVHPNGGLYWWARSPRREQPALAPDWLRAAVRPPEMPRWTYTVNGMNGRGEYTSQCLVARISAAREGTRNRTLYGALKDALRQGDLDAFEPDLAAAAIAVGLPAREVESTLRSVRGWPLMSWFNVDDKSHSDNRFRQVGLDGCGLYAVAGSYCMDQLTDGFVPDWFIKSWPGGPKAAEKLVSAGI
jgi:hypothetical protein